MVERRRGKRHRSWFAMRVGSKSGEWLAMSRNVSRTGALLALAKKLEVGEDVTLRFKVSPSRAEELEVSGRIVRVEPNAEDPLGPWSHRVAIQFADVVSEVEELLQEASNDWSDEYLVEMEEGGDL